jgi:hypothetical protein
MKPFEYIYYFATLRIIYKNTYWTFCTYYYDYTFSSEFFYCTFICLQLQFLNCQLN